MAERGFDMNFHWHQFLTFLVLLLPHCGLCDLQGPTGCEQALHSSNVGANPTLPLTLTRLYFETNNDPGLIDLVTHDLGLVEKRLTELGTEYQQFFAKDLPRLWQMVDDWLQTENQRQGHLPGLDDHIPVRSLVELATLLRQDAHTNELQFGNFAQITRNIDAAFHIAFDTAKIYYFDTPSGTFRPEVREIFQHLNIMQSLRTFGMLSAFADSLAQNAYYLPWEPR